MYKVVCRTREIRSETLKDGDIVQCGDALRRDQRIHGRKGRGIKDRSTEKSNLASTQRRIQWSVILSLATIAGLKKLLLLYLKITYETGSRGNVIPEVIMICQTLL